jgi:carboxypeptidase D
MDPYHQYGAAEAAFGHGLVDRAQLNAMAAVEQDCQSQLQAGHLSPSSK